jgi:hypothetical protein
MTTDDLYIRGQGFRQDRKRLHLDGADIDDQRTRPDMGGDRLRQGCHFGEWHRDEEDVLRSSRCEVRRARAEPARDVAGVVVRIVEMEIEKRRQVGHGKGAEGADPEQSETRPCRASPSRPFP